MRQDNDSRSPNLGVPDNFAKPGTLADRLAYVRTYYGTDTDEHYLRAYRRFTVLHHSRTRRFRSALDRAGFAAPGAGNRRRRVGSPSLTVVR